MLIQGFINLKDQSFTFQRLLNNLPYRHFYINYFFSFLISFYSIENKDFEITNKYNEIGNNFETFFLINTIL